MIKKMKRSRLSQLVAVVPLISGVFCAALTLILLIVGLSARSFSVTTAHAQNQNTQNSNGQEGGNSRAIGDSAFTTQQRRPTSPRNSSTTTTAARRRTYRRVTRPLAAQTLRPANSATTATGTTSTTARDSTPASDAEIGITVWRLRRSTAQAQAGGARILEHTASNNDEDVEWTPERIEAETPIAEGERVRISIETPRTGYLYVIDREQYSDGSFGEPYLIFPTTRTRGGDNRVSAGQVVELPGQTDTPPYFTLRRSRPNQASESLAVIVTNEPLPGVRIGRSPLKLTAAQVEGWIKDWSAPFERLEMNGGAGQTYTVEEQAAGASANRQLTQDEPLPQTIYRIAPKSGKPLLINLPLRIGQ